MQEEMFKEFFAAYHSAVFEALGKDAPKYNARIGALLSRNWLERIEKAPSNASEFKEALETWLKGDLRFSEAAEMLFNGDGTALLHIKGCVICAGNEILRNNGGDGYCPISQMVKSSMGRALKKNVELTGSVKPGPVGECCLKYKIEK